MSYATAILIDALRAEWARAQSVVLREQREDQQVRETTAALASMRGI